MKNLALLLLASLNAFLYGHSRMQAPAQAVRPPVASAAAPKAAAPRMYFHSPLDAPAMPTNSFTNMGYFSTDPSPEYRGGYNTTTTVGTVTDGQGGSAAKEVSSWGDADEAAGIKALQGVYKLPRLGASLPGVGQ